VVGTDGLSFCGREQRDIDLFSRPEPRSTFDSLRQRMASHNIGSFRSNQTATITAMRSPY